MHVSYFLMTVVWQGNCLRTLRNHCPGSGVRRSQANIICYVFMCCSCLVFVWQPFSLALARLPARPPIRQHTSYELQVLDSEPLPLAANSVG